MTKALITVPLILIGLFALCALSTLLYGYVLSCLWGWFVVGQFGLSALSVIQAAGLTVVVRFLTYTPDLKTVLDGDSTASDKYKVAAFGVIYPLATLFFGWAIHLFL